MVIQAVSGARGRRRTRRAAHSWLKRAALLVLLLLGALLLSILLFRFVNPPITTVMLADKLTGTTLHRQWVPLEDMSPQLPLAVIASEDGRFCLHWGVDWGAMRDAIKAGAVRGASTIPMQVAKNLYLWNGRSYVRKAFELPLAYVLSLTWPKDRMIEVYLNVAEFGRGIYGAEEASRYYSTRVPRISPATRRSCSPSPCRARTYAIRASRACACYASRARSSSACRSSPSAGLASCRADKGRHRLWPAENFATIRARRRSSSSRGPLRGFAKSWPFPREKSRA